MQATTMRAMGGSIISPLFIYPASYHDWGISGIPLAFRFRTVRGRIHYHQDKAVSYSVADSVEECRPGAVAECEGLKASHYDAVGDDEADKDGECLADLS